MLTRVRSGSKGNPARSRDCIHKLSDNQRQHGSAEGDSQAGSRKRTRRRSLVGLTSTTGSQIPALEPHYSPDELAELWHLSSNTVRRLCELEGGVFVIDRPERMHKRRHKTLRIPQSTAIKIYERCFMRRAA
jgi:hypothetical protein